MKSVKAYDCRNRILASISKQEAGMLDAYGAGSWRGKKKPAQAVTLACSKGALVAFLGLMRLKPRTEATAIDSKTHTKLPGTRGYRHVRTESYHNPLARIVESLNGTAAA